MTETELEAQIAELKQEKERLLGLLDKALTALGRLEERDAKPVPTLPAPQTSRPVATRKPPPETFPRTWAELKNWFFNA